MLVITVNTDHGLTLETDPGVATIVRVSSDWDAVQRHSASTRGTVHFHLRKRWDSNPRTAFRAVTCLANRPLKPLEHASVITLVFGSLLSFQEGTGHRLASLWQVEGLDHPCLARTGCKQLELR